MNETFKVHSIFPFYPYVLFADYVIFNIKNKRIWFWNLAYYFLLCVIKIQENLIPLLFPFSVCGRQTAQIKNKEKKTTNIAIW